MKKVHWHTNSEAVTVRQPTRKITRRIANHSISFTVDIANENVCSAAASGKPSADRRQRLRARKWERVNRDSKGCAPWVATEEWGSEIPGKLCLSSLWPWTIPTIVFYSYKTPRGASDLFVEFFSWLHHSPEEKKRRSAFVNSRWLFSATTTARARYFSIWYIEMRDGEAGVRTAFCGFPKVYTHWNVSRGAADITPEINGLENDSGYHAGLLEILPATMCKVGSVAFPPCFIHHVYIIYVSGGENRLQLMMVIRNIFIWYNNSRFFTIMITYKSPRQRK